MEIDIGHDTVIQIIIGLFLVIAATVPTILGFIIKRHLGSTNGEGSVADMVAKALENQGEVKARLAEKERVDDLRHAEQVALAHAHYILDEERVKPLYEHLGLRYDFPTEAELAEQNSLSIGG